MDSNAYSWRFFVQPFGAYTYPNETFWSIHTSVLGEKSSDFSPILLHFYGKNTRFLILLNIKNLLTPKKHKKLLKNA